MGWGYHSLQPQKKNEAIFLDVGLCLILWYTQTLNFWSFRVRVNHKTRHNQHDQTQYHKVNDLDFWFYQDASTAQILEPSPQDLIFSMANRSWSLLLFYFITSSNCRFRFLSRKLPSMTYLRCQLKRSTKMNYWCTKEKFVN